MANPLCHFEIMSANVEASKAFYQSIFDWQFDDESMPGYSLVHTGVEPTGGMFATPKGKSGSCINIYFQVNDIEATLKRVADQGGSVVVPKTAVPRVGHFAMVTDPQGCAIGIMEPHG